MKGKKSYFGLVFIFSIILSVFVSVPGKIMAAVEVYFYVGEAETRLTQELLDLEECPLPQIGSIPVLFVHGRKATDDPNPNYKRNWQEIPNPHVTPVNFDNLTSFKAVLDRNSHLNIEPYYIHFEDQNRSIVNDAREIDEGVDLILARHRKVEEVGTDLKVVIIAYSKGAISSRYYIKNKRWAKNHTTCPVSEFIAISPPNHGLLLAALSVAGSTALKELNNGYWRDCEHTFYRDVGKNFIRDLNDNDLAEIDEYGNGDLEKKETEAPCSRHYGQSLSDGILYVAIYAENNGDLAGGHTVQGGNCHGRLLLARNLAPDAVNLQVKVSDEPENQDIQDWLSLYPEDERNEIKSKVSIHVNTVHTPEVICKALFTATHHKAPPSDLTCEMDGDIPIIPGPKPGVVLLLDTSGSMLSKRFGPEIVSVHSSRLDLVKQAAKAFIDMMASFNTEELKFGIAAFPKQTGYARDCEGIVKQGLISLEGADIGKIKNGIDNNLSARGNTPLLGGVNTASGMFSSGDIKSYVRTIVLLTDGYHNCPYVLNSNDPQVANAVEELEDKRITVHTIGFGSKIDTDAQFLNKLATKTGGQFSDVTDTDNFTPDSWDPATALQASYKSVLVDTLGLESSTDPMGTIKAGDTISREVKVNKLDRKTCFFLSWATPGKDRLGFKIKAPDDPDNQINGEGISYYEGKTYKIVTVDKSFLSHPGKNRVGTWKIEIDAHRMNNDESENYQYSVIMDSDLKMKTSFDKSTYKTGDIITIIARITEAGRPVTGLKNVKVTVTRPEVGIGNWYAANKTTDEQLASIPDKIGDENISPIHRKAIYLTDIEKIALTIRTGPKTFYMHDDGKNGDAKGGDGIYTIRYKDTIKEGTYSFYVQATSNENSPNPFDREDMIQKYITVNANPGYSDVYVKLIRISSDKKYNFNYYYEAKVAPKDIFGNYMRPGQSVYATVVYKEGSKEIKFNDNLDGTYSSEKFSIYETDIDEGVKLVINLDGQIFTTVEKLPGGGKLSLSIHGGKTIPADPLKKDYDGSLSLGLNLDYRLSSRFSLVGLLGNNRFESASPLIDDTYWWNISMNLKYKFMLRLIPIYMNVGPGLYIPGTGSLKLGINVGLGIYFPLISRLTLELGTDYHRIFTLGSDTEFFVVHAGMNLRL